ncbi:MAG: methyl-accepting chemotaxis protein [Gammaproteobacteria bacterium]|nr:methyl-accepting chemotaxis protein [Gammaproteobacteria bacterium]
MKLVPNIRLKGRTIGQKFTLMGALLGLTFLIVASVFFYTTLVSDNASVRTSEAMTIRNQISLVKQTLESARVNVGRFFAAPNAKDRDERIAKMKKIDGLLNELIEEAHTAEEKALTTGPRDQLRFNQAKVEEAFKEQELLGYTHEEGLQGELRTAAHGIEDALKKANSAELTASLLTMRRHEKDFLLRRDAKYIKQHQEEWSDFRRLLDRTKISGGAKANIEKLGRDYSEKFVAMAEGYLKLSEHIAEFQAGFATVDPQLDQMEQTEIDQVAQLANELERSGIVTKTVFYGMLVGTGALMAFLMFLIVRNITRPVSTLQDTIHEFASGKLDVRSGIMTGDELQELSEAFDKMIEERGRFMQTEEMNEMLNNSVIGILRSVSRLGKGDLTTKAPVNEDITGALADSINQMADGISTTLAQVDRASGQVRQASSHARDITGKGKETVLGTAKGMNDIRGTIQETAKRIKRLGERSQEIGGIIKLIDDIAERTNVLALNANMQAAQAGEAGRGFMVVADEVQRLAESSKEATEQISKLVSGIQVETGDTIATMDKTIAEVVKGGELAEQAASQMALVEQTVAQLDALGAELASAVGAFVLPESVRQAAVAEPLKKAV